MRTPRQQQEPAVSDNSSKNGEKALRIGVIQGVRVIEERILRDREPVTFGTADGNTFSFASSDLPKKFTVFEVKNGEYVLVLGEDSQGRLEGNDGKKEFSALKAEHPAVGGVHRIPLADAAKGRIKLSPEITVLFHFVVPPPANVTVDMPAEVSGGFLKAIEPIFTAVLTGSFLVHFALGMYIRLTDPPEPASIDDLKDLVERIQPPKVEVKPIALPPTKPAETPGNGTGPAEPTSPKGDGTGDAGGGEEKGGGAGAGKGSGNGGTGDRNAIREGIAGKGILQLIGGRGGFGGGGGAVGSVFGAGGGISDDIGGALDGTAGVGIAGVGGAGGGVTRRGTGGGGGGGDGSGGEGGGAMGIGDLKTSGGAGSGSIDTGAKTATRVVARVKSDDIEAVDGKIDKKSVQATIRRRQDGFSACYENALKANSKLQGKLVVEFTIGDDGKVVSASVVKDGLNSSEVSSCVVGLLKRLRFPAPADGEVTISNSFVFQPGG
jgi:outer membrane biosynthesis protein TonB